MQTAPSCSNKLVNPLFLVIYVNLSQRLLERGIHPLQMCNCYHNKYVHFVDKKKCWLICQSSCCWHLLGRLFHCNFWSWLDSSFTFGEFGPLCNDECLDLIYSGSCELYPVLLGAFGRCIRSLLGIWTHYGPWLVHCYLTAKQECGKITFLLWHQKPSRHIWLLNNCPLIIISHFLQ